MAALVKDNTKYYVRGILATVITVTIGLITPLLMAETIDAIIGTKPLNAPEFIVCAFEAIGGRDYVARNLWIVALILIGLSVLRSIAMYVRGRSTAQAAERVALDLRQRLYSHLQSLTYNYHVKAETGDLIQRCTSDVETTRRFLASQLIEAVNAVLTIVIAVIILQGRHLPLTLISTAIVIPLFLFALLFFKQVIKHFKISDEAEGKMSAVLQENLTGVRVVRAFGRQRYELEKFDEKSSDLRQKNDKLLWLLAIYWGGSDGVIMMQMCASLLAGVVFAADGAITVGTLTIFLSYIGMILWPVRNLGRILSDAGKSLVSLERIDEILRQPPEADAESPITPSLSGDVVFDDVSFYYEENRPVLQHVSFTAKAGQTIAILGATGCGKSTLVHLMQRLYEPTGGQITIGGHPLDQIEKKHLRGHVGLVLQEPFLYSKTIQENVGIAMKAPEEEAVFEAARVAQAHDFILESEKGYETLVGERGVTLSGGQKQRIAIARTLLKDNDILIFDDSLSAVDTQTDAAIRGALSQKRQGVTTFIISHRITTLAEADQILVLEEGRVVQQGTHKELIEQPGLYRRIYEIQGAIEQEMEEDAG
ncbi:MAG: ABC transporter ATP-binding protein/permease [Oscillospiraceae bacterium]|jgi:ATP-binding cassette subfamily B protein|nr:ABC transporter ATP-binding protein/permease [Oscillospiraceae bacterium]